MSAPALLRLGLPDATPGNRTLFLPSPTSSEELTATLDFAYVELKRPPD